jgi:hypothetical protein
LICADDTAVAVRFAGAVSVGAGVVVDDEEEYALRFPAASVARTR